MNPPNVEKIHKNFRMDFETGRIVRKTTGKPGSYLKADGSNTLKAEGLEWPAKRVAWWFHHGEYPTAQIVCRNGDNLDLRKENLATRSQVYHEQNVRATVCLTCGTVFQRTNGRQKFCSRLCIANVKRAKQTICRDCGGNLDVQGRYRCKTCLKAQGLRYRLAAKYSLTISDFEALLERQGNTCAICRTAPEDGPHVDHDHVTGAVRGILCSSCNKGLGMFRDSAELLSAAVRYLCATG